MIQRFHGEDARITELKDYAERHPMFQTDENVSIEEFFDKYLYYDEEDGGIGIWHNRDIHDHHIEELWWSANSLPNVTKADIDWFFEYIEERWIKYSGSPSGVVGNSEVLLSEDEDFVV